MDNNSSEQQSAGCLRESRVANKCLKLVDVFSNAFFFTVVTIFFWAATSDIIYAYFFPENTVYLYGSALLLANVIILPSYLFQDEIQSLYNRVCGSGRVTDCQISGKPEKTKRSYYDRALIFRFVYSYVLSIGYVAQWVSYWDISALLVADVNYIYFVVFSFIAIIAYRLILNSTLEYYCLCVPFCLARDTKFDSYCLQWREITLKNKKLEHLLHWFYYEQVELMISVFIWKGIWDLLETGVNYDILKGNKDADFISIVISFVIGYSLYFLVLIYEYALNKSQKGGFSVKIIREAVYFVSFISVVAVWRALWAGFDYYFYYTEYRDVIIFSVHFGGFALLMLMQVGTLIYSPGSSLPDESEVNYDVSVKEFIAQHKRVKFFAIEYFAFQDS